MLVLYVISEPSHLQVVRWHFPYMLDFDRYSADELVGVFNQQCERDAVRLGSTVTQVVTVTQILTVTQAFYCHPGLYCHRGLYGHPGLYCHSGHFSSSS